MVRGECAWTAPLSKPCKGGAWGDPTRCLHHGGLPIGSRGRCPEGPVTRIDAKPSRSGDTVRLAFDLATVRFLGDGRAELVMPTDDGRRLAYELTHAAGVVDATRGQSCVCSSCGTFYADAHPGQDCACGQPVVAVEASL